MRLGFVGTGRITAALVESFCTLADPPARILVSPRNAEKAAELAARFPQVVVAHDNQAVVDGSDCVFLALRPPAVAVLGELRFPEDRQIISLMPTRPYGLIRELVAPAEQIAWALPLPSVAQHVGPIVVYPGERFALDLLARVGTPIAVDSEDHLRILWTPTALLSPLFALIEEVAQWCASAGVDRKTAGQYTASVFHALCVLAMQVPDGRYAGLIDEAATPGGLNEQALRMIRERQGYRPFLEALDAILTRLGGTPPGRPGISGS